MVLAKGATDESRRPRCNHQVETAFAEASPDVDLYRGAAWLQRQVNEYMPLIGASLTRESLDAYFASDGTVPPERVQLLVALMSALPGILEAFVHQAITTKAETIIHSGGRPQTLTAEQKREIVERVAKLHLQGVNIGPAQERIAQQMNVSKRTVQRVWLQRAKLAKRHFKPWKMSRPSSWKQSGEDARAKG